MKLFIIIFIALMLFIIPFILMLLKAYSKDDNSFYWLIALMTWFVAWLAGAMAVPYAIH